MTRPGNEYKLLDNVIIPNNTPQGTLTHQALLQHMGISNYESDVTGDINPTNEGPVDISQVHQDMAAAKQFQASFFGHLLPDLAYAVYDPKLPRIHLPDDDEEWSSESSDSSIEARGTYN
ncbi:hypothetical protein SPOG_04573 [Schizosaccharomyces cryophilus OY26]|uniref:Uncharacterized protein n=1 Tax=Schizosaccharomyces cryophilus (strain OY26 / ATCC MYA-4695 / CBS 11777 / NBRC 106824 / NRRL Y48691) TaxID=653667 RepID=S9W6H8_SCHCR|nr:uncharacterized protein SPOG_04573 [Schizosaccharomyces cryophilus OY26]EPY53425.1 hypothetical protein SPOG_04573 [Schizosaccharomyces cryophilus OY26]